MKASFLDLRKKTCEILRALDRNEKVEISYRGRPKAVLTPVQGEAAAAQKTEEHPAFGMWADRPEFKNPSKHVRQLRKGRFHDL